MKVNALISHLITGAVGLAIGLMLCSIGHSELMSDVWRNAPTPPPDMFRTYPNNPYSGFSRPDDPLLPGSVGTLSPC